MALTVDTLHTDGTRMLATSANNGPGTTGLRVRVPNAPVAGEPNRILIVLPVKPDQDTTFGDGYTELVSYRNTYNLTLVAPEFHEEPWIADHSSDSNQQYETYVAGDLVTWLRANISSTAPIWLFSFSKGGLGVLTLLFKYPAVFERGAAWDVPATKAAVLAQVPGGVWADIAYGSEANYDSNYDLLTHLDDWRTPFLANTRLWLSGDDSVYEVETDTLHDGLDTESMRHAWVTGGSRAHNWTSGWIGGAISGLVGLLATNTVLIAGAPASGNGTSGASSLTFAWNNSASATYLAVLIGGWDGGNSLPSGVTYAGVAMTLRASVAFDSNFARIYSLAAPAAGSNNVVVTYSGTVDEHAAGAIGMTTVNATTPVGTAATAGANGANLTLAPSSVAGALALGVTYTNTNPSPGGTQQFEVNPVSGASGSWVNGQAVEGQASATNVTWTMASTGRVGAAIAFLPVVAEVFEESVAFGMGVGVTPAARASFGSALSLSTAAAIEPPTARAAMAAGLSLNTDASIQPPARLTANVLATLSAQTTMAPEALLAVIAQVGLSCTAIQDVTSNSAYSATLTLITGAATTAAATLEGIGRLTLTTAGLVDASVQVSGPTLVSLGAAAVLTPQSQLTGISTVAVTADASVTSASRLVAAALQAFTAATALDAFTGEQIVQEQLSLTAAAGLSPSARAILFAQHTLALAAQIDAATQSIVHVAVDYVAQAGVTSTATGVHGAALALQVQALVTARTTATMRNAVTLAIATALESAATLANAPAASVLKAVADELRAATATDETLTA